MNDWKYRIYNGQSNQIKSKWLDVGTETHITFIRYKVYFNLYICIYIYIYIYIKYVKSLRQTVKFRAQLIPN